MRKSDLEVKRDFTASILPHRSGDFNISFHSPWYKLVSRAKAVLKVVIFTEICLQKIALGCDISKMTNWIISGVILLFNNTQYNFE